MEAIRRIIMAHKDTNVEWDKIGNEYFVNENDFDSASKRIKPSFSKTDVERLNKFKTGQDQSMYR
jgi:hypothetical protein